MISVRNLTKRFGGKAAVSDLSFEVAKGEILGLLGPNGAGKTTTMRILTGFFPPTSGAATIDDLDVVEQTREVKKKVGYLPEHVPLYQDMTPAELLRFAAEAKGVPKKDRARLVNSALERCNLGAVAGQLIGTLSRGFRQRVGLAQAIVNEPKVLILDEPTVGLDPTQVRDIRSLLREIGRDSTVILSSHILSEVSQMCSRVVIMVGGELKAMDTPAALTAAMHGEARYQLKITDAEDEEVQRKLEEMEAVSAVARKDRGTFLVVSQSDALAPLLARTAVESGWALQELRPLAEELEDLFIALVEQDREPQSKQTSGETP